MILRFKKGTEFQDIIEEIGRRFAIYGWVDEKEAENFMKFPIRIEITKKARYN